MTITKELDLANFNFWSGARDHEFTYSELKELEQHLDDLYPEGTTETKINELFWFEEQFLCECIGLDYDEYLERWYSRQKKRE